jgi:serine O-acetyltransferase
VLRSFAADVRAKAVWVYERDDWKSRLKALLADGTPAMFWYRLMQWSRRWRLAPLEFVCSKMMTCFCGCVIGRGAEFGARFVLIHSNGVVINGAVGGGDDVKIEHQVTIGAERRMSPTIGDRVFIGAGAKVIGAVRIGDDARIGANAVVIKDVPPGCTAVGVPAKNLEPKPSSASPDLLPADVLSAQ